MLCEVCTLLGTDGAALAIILVPNVKVPAMIRQASGRFILSPIIVSVCGPDAWWKRVLSASVPKTKKERVVWSVNQLADKRASTLPRLGHSIVTVIDGRSWCAGFLSSGTGFRSHRSAGLHHCMPCSGCCTAVLLTNGQTAPLMKRTSTAWHEDSENTHFGCN